MLGEVAKGADPIEESKQVCGLTVNDICDWYLDRAEAGKIIGRSRRPIKSSTLAMDRSRIDAHIRPLLGHRIIGTLRLGDIEAAQADIAAGVTSKPRVGSRGGSTKGGEGVASRTMSTLHSILEHAVRLGEIEKNPARGVRRLASTPRMRWLSQAELRRLGVALREAEADLEHPKGLAVIRLLLLTGFRRIEALGLERGWLLEEENAVHFATTKTGAQRRVIGQAAVDLLLSQPDTGSKFFFPADWGESHFVGVVRVLDRVCHRADIEKVTPHVLRHTFASVAGGLGYSELTIAALLGHASRGITQRYVHIDEPLRAAATAVAQQISLWLDGDASGAG
jgi:site-specific recombinase XerD